MLHRVHNNFQEIVTEHRNKYPATLNIKDERDQRRDSVWVHGCDKTKHTSIHSPHIEGLATESVRHSLITMSKLKDLRLLNSRMPSLDSRTLHFEGGKCWYQIFKFKLASNLF